MTDRINNINETGGAGDEGTDELVQKLQQDTPGQPTKRKPKMKKFRDILEGVDPIQENVNAESKVLAKEINDAARRETGGDKKDFQTVAKLIGSGKLKDAAKHMSKLDTVVLEDLVTFIMGHESVFKAMYPKARQGQAVAVFAREGVEEEISERVHYAFDTQDGAKEFQKKVAGMPMNIVRVGSGKYYVVELRPGANQGVQDKAAKIAVSIGLSEEFYNIAEGYRKPTPAEIAADKKKDGKKGGDRHSRIKGKVYGNAMGKEEVEEAMSPADKAKRLKMIKQAVEKLNKSNLDRAKKDALKMMKDSGMFDEEVQLDEALEMALEIEVDLGVTFDKGPLRRTEAEELKREWAVYRQEIAKVIKPLGGLVTDTFAPNPKMTNTKGQRLGTMTIGTRGDTSKFDPRKIKAALSRSVDITDMKITKLDEELEEAKGAPKIKGLNIYGSEINGLRSGMKYYSAKPVDMRGKLMFRVVDEFGSIETLDLKTFSKRFG